MPFMMPVAIANQIKDAEWKISGDYRSRYERRIERDFTGAHRDSEANLLQRARVTFDWKSKSGVSATAQYQYAHSLMWRPTLNKSDENSQLTLLNAKSTNSEGVWTVGRQRINLNDERLVGSSDWTNVGRSFDAVRFQSKRFSAFAAKLGTADAHSRNARLIGLSADSNLGSTNFLYKADNDGSGDVRIYTLDQVARVNLGKGVLQAEAAVQTGRNKGKNHSAWAYHVGYDLPVTPKLNVLLEMNSASGGTSGSTVRTFDNLYPTNHKFFGVMDLMSWKNINHTMVTVNYKATKNMDMKVRLATATLRDPKDYWYAANGKPNTSNGSGLRDLTGVAGRNLGNEADFELVYRRTSTDTISAGVAMFLPGHFVKSLAGDGKTQKFLYVQYAVRF
ncbi:MAG: alginate export family protein [Armatimonadetes bacterium]|nr:alginate export family protein [Armatimonadota bacterium]